jgi:hypothetical protein
MKQFFNNLYNKCYNFNKPKDLIIIASSGGSGSSFIVDKFIDNKWRVCIRPDGGSQKLNHSIYEIYRQRTKFFFKSRLSENSTEKELCEETLRELKKINHGKIMLMSIAWGAKGLFNNKNVKTIYLVRDPVYSFNSYSGGGWRSEGGDRRIKYVGANGPNDKKWIDLWLNDFSYWKQGAEIALKNAKSGAGYLVRYHSFKEDWSKIPNAPPIHIDFLSKDSPEKYKGVLSSSTIDYLRDQTNDLWKDIVNLKSY